MKVAVAEGKTTKEVISTAVDAATETMVKLGNNNPDQQVDTSMEAAKEAVGAKLTTRQTLSVAAAEAATAAVDAGAKKSVVQIASLAAKSTLHAATKAGLTATQAALPIAKAAGEAAVRSGDLRFMSTEEIASAADAAVQQLFQEDPTPEKLSIAALAAGMAAANSARDSAKRHELSAQAAVYAQKAGLKAKIGNVRAGSAAATVAAAALVDSSTEPEKQREEAAKIALDAATAAGLTSLQASEASKAAVDEAISFAIPGDVLAQAGKAAKAAAENKHSQKDALQEAVTLAKLAGKAAKLAGMTLQQVAVVVGTKAATAIFQFAKIESPAALTRKAVTAALEASVALTLTSEQVGSAAVYAAAGAAAKSQKVFFLNTQEAAELAAKTLRTVMDAAKKTAKANPAAKLLLLDTAAAEDTENTEMPNLADLVNGLSSEVKKVLSATAAGCTAEKIAQGAGLEQPQVERAAAKATKKVALSLDLPPPKAANLAAVAAGSAAGRAAAVRGLEETKVAVVAAEATVQAAKEAGLPEEQAKEIAATTAATAVAEGAAIASVREISEELALDKRTRESAKSLDDFSRLDANGDGRLSADELANWKPVDDFSMLERNGDGKISMKEFQKWNPEFADVVASKQVSVLSLSRTSNTLDKFDAMDLNHDGKISPDELNNWKRHDTFSLLDVNHDGRVSPEELSKWHRDITIQGEQVAEGMQQIEAMLAKPLQSMV